VIGDECHIVSRKGSGPRSDTELAPEDYDKCENLILLCKVHHKLVDDQPGTYTAELLRIVKSGHETWVRDCLGQDAGDTSKKDKTVHLLPRIRTGKELMDLCGGAYACVLDHDELGNEEEVEVVGAFLQNVQDWGDIWDLIESAEHVRVGFSMTQEIERLEAMGFLVFATRQRRKVEVAGRSDVWPTFVMTVVRETNPGITVLGTLASRINS